jgi:hypothetical protein
MSAFAGPEISNSGLVFYFDINNTEKSWKGKPTTNLVNPSWAAWSVDGSGQGNIGTRTINSTYYCTISDVNQNTRQNIYIEGVSASTTYTFSVKYKKISGTPTLRFQIQAYNGVTYLSLMSFATTAELGITDKEDWQTASITLTTPANTTRVLWFMQDGDDYTTYTHSFELKEVQMEAGSIYSPFVDGTRSNTQAILDLTGSNTITANSLTYNSNNTFSFDGSNYVSSTALSGSYSSFTVSLWLYSTAVENYRNPIDCNYAYNGTSGNIGPRLEQSSSGNLTWIFSGVTNDNGLYNFYTIIDSGMSLNKWYHAAITLNAGSSVSTYLDGRPISLNQNVAQGFVNVMNSVNVGRGFHLGDSARYFKGKVDNVMIHNTALTPAEIARNFQALRGRYGI